MAQVGSVNFRNLFLKCQAWKVGKSANHREQGMFHLGKDREAIPAGTESRKTQTGETNIPDKDF